ncbi:MAG: hypothetical protein AABX98_03645, partial [Nanoarchaeota archaeon]
KLLNVYTQLTVVQQQKNMSSHTVPTEDIDLKILEYNLAVESRDTVESMTGMLGDTFHDDNEFLARMVDSACSIYFGPVDDLYFPLTREDTGFIGSMYFHGKPLFAKCVERYEVARAMVAAGVSASDTRSQLEYATRFSWEGKTYKWSAAHIEFIGEIPMAKR